MILPIFRRLLWERLWGGHKGSKRHRSGVKRGQYSSELLFFYLLPQLLLSGQQYKKEERKELSAKGIERKTSSASPPSNGGLKLARQLVAHKASPSGSSPWQKSHYSKKHVWGKGYWGVTKKNNHPKPQPGELATLQ